MTTDTQRIFASLEKLSVDTAVAIEEHWKRKILPLADAFGKLTSQFASATRFAHAMSLALNPRAHRRCAVCRPHAFPSPVLGMKPSMPARKAARWNRRRR